MKMTNLKAFSLIEMIIAITIFSLVVTIGMYLFSSISMGKIKIVGETDIEKESYYFSEKLFQEIRRGGLIDYEEYFNRKVFNSLATNATFKSGHYEKSTGFGNLGTSYICSSIIANNTNSIKDGLINNIPLNSTGGCRNNDVQKGKPQRYGQYSLQFYDYGGDFDGDDSNSIKHDDDDRQLFEGPTAFDNNNVQELYLISGDGKKRTYFRRNVKKDPNAPNGIDCDFGDHKKPKGEGCLGTIEFLKLVGKDDDNNGYIDIWYIDENFAGNNNTKVTDVNTEQYRIPLFSDSINVSSVKFFLYPSTDPNLTTINNVSSPYLRIQYTLKSSRSRRKGIRGEIPELTYSSTINLTDIFSYND